VLVELHLDLDAIVIRLVDPAETAHVTVVIDAPTTANPMTHDHRLGDVVAARHVGHLEETGDVAIDPAVIRFLAAGEVGASWERDLAAMMERAAEHGRLSPSGWIVAIVVWPSTRR
jgi:hypothetical protein